MSNQINENIKRARLCKWKHLCGWHIPLCKWKKPTLCPRQDPFVHMSGPQSTKLSPLRLAQNSRWWSGDPVCSVCWCLAWPRHHPGSRTAHCCPGSPPGCGGRGSRRGLSRTPVGTGAGGGHSGRPRGVIVLRSSVEGCSPAQGLTMRSKGMAGLKNLGVLVKWIW